MAGKMSSRMLRDPQRYISMSEPDVSLTINDSADGQSAVFVQYLPVSLGFEWWPRLKRLNVSSSPARASYTQSHWSRGLVAQRICIFGNHLLYCGRLNKYPDNDVFSKSPL